MSDIIKTQCSFATKAMHHPAHRFDHLYRLICRQEWIWAAVQGVLANKGARTPGIDGVTKEDFTSEHAQRALVQEIEQELRDRSFRPSPVRRVHIPKSNGKHRPLGISTLKDRVVQMLLKMVLEPIWESDFLNCSNGFRPGRRTMDCIALLDSYINERNKYFWVIEGDIRAAFDSVHQTTLLNLLAQRVADRRLLELIDSLLKAGLMQGKLLHRTETGISQGAICSPLLANIYLHQVDLYWWKHYGSLDRKAKERRRQAHQGNCALIRYADDWLLLTNGSNKILIKPSKKALQRVYRRIKDIVWANKAARQQNLIGLLNPIITGWVNYHCHAVASVTFHRLDYLVWHVLWQWAVRRHRNKGRQWIRRKYFRTVGTRTWTFACDRTRRKGDAPPKLMSLAYAGDTKIRRHVKVQAALNPYSPRWEAYMEKRLTLQMANSLRGKGRILSLWKSQNGRCPACEEPLTCDTGWHVHHVIYRAKGGSDHRDNLRLLHPNCHRQLHVTDR